MCITFILDPPLLPLVKVLSVVNLNASNFILTMNCLPDKNDLQYSYTWIKKDNVIPSRAQGINSPTLTIFNLIPEDSGDYQCTVSNRTGKISSNFSTVNVIGNDILQNNTLCLHSYVRMQCLHQQSQCSQVM